MVVAELAGAAVLAPMDGFHLAQAELVRLGRRDRMGAPDPFDAGGYAALLRRLRDHDEDVVYAPAFRRAIDEPIADAIAIPRAVPLVVTEGNYLLLQDGDWARVRPRLDEAWFVELDEEIRGSGSSSAMRSSARRPESPGRGCCAAIRRTPRWSAPTRERADVVLRLPG